MLSLKMYVKKKLKRHQNTIKGKSTDYTKLTKD